MKYKNKTYPFFEWFVNSQIFKKRKIFVTINKMNLIGLKNVFMIETGFNRALGGGDGYG